MNKQERLLTQWLCHSDARQVFDLPAADPSSSQVYDLGGGRRPPDLKRPSRQVRDLPGIGVAKPRRVSILLLFAFLLLIAAPAFAKTKEQKQAEVRKSAHETLARLYTARPSAKATIKAAAGYAAFSNFGMKILLAGGGKGQGIAFDNATKKVTYMKMVELQAGLGMGIKKFRTIFVFETKDAMDHFVNNGWEFGGQATAAAKSGNKGGSYQGAVQVMPGVWMYQLTDKGLALELTGKGTKYYKDDDLN